jgi:membrane protease YdiL (CAAX protease family)
MTSPEETKSDSLETEAVAPWWHTIFILLPLAIGSAVSAYQHTLEHVSIPGVSVRLSAYVTVMIEEWFAVLLLWLSLRNTHGSFAKLISGKWQSVTAFLKDCGLAAAFIFVVLPIMAITEKLIGANPNQTGFVPKSTAEAIVWIAVALTAGFCEELTFRGYLMRQFRAWTGYAGLAIVAQGIAYGLMHGYGSRYMIVVAIHGWLLGVMVLWRKSLRPGIISHFLQDAIFGLLAFSVLR